MQESTTIADVRARIAAAGAHGQRVGLVPTMGFLHAGHLSLVTALRTRCDCVVMSSFVNPLQFGADEDLARYPRDVDRDRSLAASAGVDVLFAPDTHEIYPAPPAIRVSAGESGARWEGAIRPGHFDGVLTVVAKLFHIVAPDVVAFGQKDIQQAVLIRQMICDLDIPIELLVVPTIREDDGLAMSSRNVFLSSADRTIALALSRALRHAAADWRAGSTDSTALSARIDTVLREGGVSRADYIAIVEPRQMTPVSRVSAGDVIAVAARVGATRLIDNVILGE